MPRRVRRSLLAPEGLVLTLIPQLVKRLFRFLTRLPAGGAPQRLIEIKILIGIGYKRIDRLGLPSSPLGGGPLLLSALRLSLCNLFKLLGSRLMSAYLSFQSLGLGVLLRHALRRSLRALLRLLCAHERSLGVHPKVLGFSTLPYALRLKSFRHRQHEETHDN